MIITKGYRSSVQRLFRILTTSQCTTSIALQTWRKHFNFTKSRPTLELLSIIDHCKLNRAYWQQVWKSLFSIRQLRDLIGKGGEGWRNKSSLQTNSLLIFSACTESKIILRRRQHTKPASIEFRHSSYWMDQSSLRKISCWCDSRVWPTVGRVEECNVR